MSNDDEIRKELNDLKIVVARIEERISLLQLSGYNKQNVVIPVSIAVIILEIIFKTIGKFL